MKLWETVAVLNATGCLGSRLIKDLLQRGYVVRGGLLGSDTPEKVKYLKELPWAAERLTLWEADARDRASLHVFFGGAQGVFYISLTRSILVNEDSDNFVREYVSNTRNVLAMAAGVGSVKRLVRTSSVLVNHLDRRWIMGPPPNVDESWNSSEFLARSAKVPHTLAEVLAEKVAEEFAQNQAFKVINVVTGYLFGRIVSPFLELIHCELHDFLTGRQSDIRNGLLGITNFRDVSWENILTYEDQEADGRYIVVERMIHLREFVRLLYISCPLFTSEFVTYRLLYDLEEECEAPGVNSTKIKSLGLTYNSLEFTIQEFIRTLQTKGLLVPRYGLGSLPGAFDALSSHRQEIFERSLQGVHL